MGVDVLVNKAKDAVGGNSTDAAVDQAAEAAKGVAPDQADARIDQAAQAIKDKIQFST